MPGPPSSLAASFVVDTTGTLVTYPPSLHVPSSATCRLATPSHSRPAAGESATVDALSTTLSGAHSRGARRLTLGGSVAQVAGRLYLLVDATTGDRFVVESTKTQTAATMDVREPLPMDVATASTLQGFGITFPVDADATEEIGRGSAIWIATVNGVAGVQWAQDLRIIARAVAYQLTSTTLVAASPYALRLQPNADNSYDDVIRFAWDFVLVPALLGKGLRPERIASWEQINAWHLAAVEARLADLFDTDLDVVARKQAASMGAQNLTLATSSLWYDADDSLEEPDEDASVAPEWSTTLVHR